jgi:DNA-directed RNA polymerase subunit RPC12/RpoP
MALQQCHECKKKVSTEAENCPNCGAPVLVEPKNKPYGCLTLIFLLLIALFLLNYFEKKRWNSLTPEQQAQEIKQKAQEKKRNEQFRLHKKKQEEEKREEEKFKNRCDRSVDPVTYTQFAIEKRLKNPKSLDMYILDASIMPFKIEGNLDCHWKVRGEFDATNAYGGLIRNSYESTIHYYYKTEEWHVTALEIYSR